MSKLAAVLGSSGNPGPKLYAEDVFSTYTYTGNGSSQSINNGIDLAGKGGLVWIKGRDIATEHNWVDTARGVNKQIRSDTTGAEITDSTSINAFNSNGFSMGSYAKINVNGNTYVSWTFRKAPKFFDIVTYTGDGTSGRQIPHNLGIGTGVVVIKAFNSTSNWTLRGRNSNGSTFHAVTLNTTGAENSAAAINNGYAGITSASAFTVYAGGVDITAVNANGINYVAYLFAHDPSADGLIQCGSFDYNASTAQDVTLGWEPQMVFCKAAGYTSNWFILDNARGLPADGGDKVIVPNLPDTEGTWSDGYGLGPRPFGFNVGASWSGSGATFIYVAIRRPNKPPTSGTQVYNAIARTGTGAAATVTGVGFSPDWLWSSQRARGSDSDWHTFDRLRGVLPNITGSPRLKFDTIDAETTGETGQLSTLNPDGYTINGAGGSVNANAQTYINHFFKRAPGFMDEVCYTGNSNASRAISHGLAVPPEMIIFKSRNSTYHWQVFCASLGAYSGNSSKGLYLDLNYAVQNSAICKTDGMTSSVFTVSNAPEVNGNGVNFVAYLFATLAGVSKVSSYVGNGSSQTINCGFTAGARFVLIKRTDSTGDWFVWDTVRGIVAGNDPHLSLNGTAAEVTTDDSIDPDASGFIINQLAATNLNVNAANYIYLAIA
jgi:hypothetical protein